MYITSLSQTETENVLKRLVEIMPLERALQILVGVLESDMPANIKRHSLDYVVNDKGEECTGHSYVIIEEKLREMTADGAISLKPRGWDLFAGGHILKDGREVFGMLSNTEAIKIMTYTCVPFKYRDTNHK